MQVDRQVRSAVSEIRSRGLAVAFPTCPVACSAHLARHFEEVRVISAVFAMSARELVNMRVLLSTGLALLAAFSGALADGASLAGSLWQCSRASDRSQFVSTFYPGGGVGWGLTPAARAAMINPLPWSEDVWDRPNPRQANAGARSDF